MATINKSQKINLENGFIQSSGSNAFQKLDMKSLDGLLADYAEKYKDGLVASIKRHKITASGEMEKSITFTLSDKNGIKVLDIYMVDYAKFVDKGVKGWGSTKNAPSSPYRFKTKGMNQEGRNSIRRYIESGKAKISSVRKYRPVGGERKSKSLIEAKVDTLVYLIKKYGIKTTNFIKEPTEKVFSDLAVRIADEYAVNISVQITK